MKQSTSFGNINYDNFGQGAKIFFLHGGPGMSYKYLIPAFEQLRNNYELYFFDQLGCGESEGISSVSEDSTIHSSIEFINKCIANKPYYIISHSWGAYLLGAMLEKKLLTSLPDGVIFFSPTPFTREKFDLAGGQLVARIPDDVLKKIGDLLAQETDKAGEEFMQLALPFYSGHSRIIKHLGRTDYRPTTYNKVSKTLVDFNHEHVFLPIKERLNFVFGNTDYIVPTMFSNIFLSQNSSVIEGGHFCFAEHETISNLNMVNSLLLKDKHK